MKEIERIGIYFCILFFRSIQLWIFMRINFVENSAIIFIEIKIVEIPKIKWAFIFWKELWISETFSV